MKNYNGEIDLDTCTLQEACDYAIRKIVEQGKPCMDDSGGCRYIMSSPTPGKEERCVFGHLLPKGYDVQFCDDSAFDLIDNWKNWFDDETPNLFVVQPNVFNELQKIHDLYSSYSWSDKGKMWVSAICNLRSIGIDVSGKHWHAWRDLVAEANPDYDFVIPADIK